MQGSHRSGPASAASHALAARITRDGAFSVDDGLWILEALLEEVASLHRFDRAHGALGPENVFVEDEPDGSLRVTVGPADRTGGTWAGGLLAPERRAGELPSKEADVWALGALAFPIFAGAPPLWGANGHLEPLAVAAPEIPLRLGVIAGRMLAPEPDLRPSIEEAWGAVRGLRAAWGPAPEEDAGRESTRDRSSPSWLGGLLRRKAERPAGSATPGPSTPRTGGGPSLSLLCLEDLGPIPRRPAPPATEDDIQVAIDETLSAGLLQKDLPPFPSVAWEVVELARRDDVGANDLVRVVSRDPALIARILRIANSVYANRGVEVTSVRDAVTRLGVREVANVAAAAATRTLFEVEGSPPHRTVAETGRLVWTHALASALSASRLAMECGADDGRAFLAGMLHDIGKTLALRGFGRLITAGVFKGIDPAAVVGPALEATHVELGLRLARAWNLPAPVVRACAEHHAPQHGPQEDRELHVVRIASALASLRVDRGWSLDRVREAQESAALLGFDRRRLRATAAQVRELAARAEALAAD